MKSLSSTINRALYRVSSLQRELEESFVFSDLPQDLQKLAYLFSEGWTENEIAQSLHVRRGVVHRARQRLAECLRQP